MSIDNAVLLLVGALMIVGAVAAVRLLAALRARIANPPVAASYEAVVAVLTPYLYKAIFAGEKMALTAMEGCQKTLMGRIRKPSRIACTICCRIT